MLVLRVSGEASQFITFVGVQRHGQGRRGSARDILAPVYGWFTQGFDTLDLRQAKILLDELA
jgi:hypothetical protein